MLEDVIIDGATQAATEIDPVEYLRTELESGRDWPVALLETIGMWTAPEELYNGERYEYFIGGEAFDWLLLAQRLFDEVGELIPEQEKEDLLFSGKFPKHIDDSQFKDLLGVEKYRGYLNYYYGVIVEETLQLAAEGEVHKRHLSNGNQYQGDFSEEAFGRIYRESKSDLFLTFREEMGYPNEDKMSFSEYKEFTYWLFKYRLKISDKAKIASDTKKGLDQLHKMNGLARVPTPTA